MGKTSLALNIASNVAKSKDLPVAIFSLEMSKEQLTLRLLAAKSKVDSNRLRSGKVSQQDLEKISQGIEEVGSLPIYIEDNVQITAMQIGASIRRLQSRLKKPTGLILIDYLQLMGGGGENRVQELARITRSLKAIARESNAPVVALSQLSRGVEQRTNKRPMMSDLRESGSIEQDADLVLMLYRDEYYNPDTPERGIAELSISKHRNGPTGVIKLMFNPALTEFLNMENRNNQGSFTSL
jgi:replicative DNA helicase